MSCLPSAETMTTPEPIDLAVNTPVFVIVPSVSGTTCQLNVTSERIFPFESNAFAVNT